MFLCLHLFADKDLFYDTLLIDNKGSADSTHLNDSVYKDNYLEIIRFYV